MTIAARPTSYTGIAMRSRTEARFAAFLDRAGIEWEYEPEAFASPAGQYLPDFGLRQGPHAPVVWVDVKGPFPDAATAGRLLARMAIIWETDPAAALVVAPAGSRYVLMALPGVAGFAAMGGWGSGFFGVCSACRRVGLAWRQRVAGEVMPWIQCGGCGATGPAVAILDPWYTPESRP